MRNFSIFLAYFAKFLKAQLEYRFNFFAGIFANMLVALSGLLFVFFLVDGKQIESLQGWTRSEVLFIYGYSMMSMALFSCVAINLYGFGDRYIIQGQFDRILLRPLNTLGQVLFESFNLEALGTFCVGLATLGYAAAQLGLHFSLLDVAWLLFSSVSGAIILCSVFVILASVSFHFEDRMGIAPPFYNLIAFGRYPLPIFNRLIQFILSWIVPFAFVAFYPATHFFNRRGYEFLCYFSPLMALIFLSLAWLAWQFGVSRYESTGN